MTHLRREEKSANTLSKYGRDIRRFVAFFLQVTKGQARGPSGALALTKEITLAYKESLCAAYTAASVNSMLAAVNGFLTFLDLGNLRIKQLRIQRRAFCDQGEELSRAEYDRALDAAGAGRLSLALQTICATGIRVSELRHITAAAVRAGTAHVQCKGKARQIFIPADLRRVLLAYMAREKLTAGSVFLTRSGRPLNRSNIWRDMKRLAKAAGVPPKKLFPHNLRRLFARLYYSMTKDIARLSDILGHSDGSVTRIYIMTSGREHARQLNKMKLVRL
jgi:site-specific recombinase XerD